ncbi:MAG: 3'-5' exonuclease [Bacteroidia bacterium]|nr:3'-5' exonuclease [Bacteroidia bacterium]
MFKPSQIENLLFLDIETAPMAPTYEQLDPRMRELWDSKMLRYQRQEPDKDAPQLFLEKAGIHAEFGRVVCISCGYVFFDELTKQPEIKMKSYFGENEKEILTEFSKMVNKFTQSKPGRSLCAHNGKEFDFPYLGRRYVIQGLEIPYVLRTHGKKPWETGFVDTMELWKFGDYKAYTSLNLLSAVLGIPSPKDDIDGSQVRSVFWEERDHERIRVYCEKDVLTTAQVLLRMSLLPLIKVPENF